MAAEATSVTFSNPNEQRSILTCPFLPRVRYVQRTKLHLNLDSRALLALQAKRQEKALSLFTFVFRLVRLCGREGKGYHP